MKFGNSVADIFIIKHTQFGYRLMILNDLQWLFEFT